MLTINKLLPGIPSMEILNASTGYVAGLKLVRIDNHEGNYSMKQDTTKEIEMKSHKTHYQMKSF